MTSTMPLAPAEQGAEMDAIKNILDMPLPESIRLAQRHYDALVASLLDQGLEDQWIVVFTDGRYEVHPKYDVLEDQFEAALASDDAILRCIEPVEESFTISFG